MNASKLKYKHGENAFFAGKAWQYGCATVDMAYNCLQCKKAWDAIKQLDKNNPNFKRAIEQLHDRLSDLFKRTKDAEAQLQTGPLD